MSKPVIEVATFTPASAITASENGADRIELCSGYAEGGLSPSIGAVALVREKIKIPLHVMVRPRVGDFVYGKAEFAAIEKEIAFYKHLGVNGIVVGVLDEEGYVNEKALKNIVKLASPMSVTFHRAFDQCKHQLQELPKLIDCGVERVLTSGGKSSVMEGIDRIQALMEAAENKIIILPGGGINIHNAREIVEKLGAKEIHFSGKRKVESPLDKNSIQVSLCSPHEVSDFSWYECNDQLIKQMTELFN